MNNNTPRRSPRLCRSSTRFDPISRNGRSQRRGNPEQQQQQQQEPLVPPSSATGAGETIPSRPLLRRSRRLNSQQQSAQQQQQQQRQQQQEREQRQRRSARQPSPSTLLRNVVEVPANMTGPAMLADVITQAVVNAYRERRNNNSNSNNNSSDDDHDHYVSASSSTAPVAAGTGGAASFDPSSLFLDSAIPPEANSEENSFFRIVRMPLVVSSDATTTTTTAAAASSSPEVVMPMYIVGYRTQQEVTSTPPEHFQQAAPAPTPVSPAASPASSPEIQQTATANGVRRSQRIRDLRQRQQQEEDERRRNQRSESDNRRYTVSRWIIYFISGVDNNNPSYDDLVAAWQAEHRNTGLTVEQIHSCAPQQPFTPQVAASIVGGNEQCYVCLEKFELSENVRVLACQHGFHQECIDKWLIEAQNRCPLCRETVVPS